MVHIIYKNIVIKKIVITIMFDPSLETFLFFMQCYLVDMAVYLVMGILRFKFDNCLLNMTFLPKEEINYAKITRLHTI